MSLSEMMMVGGSIDYTSYRSKNPEKCNEIESRYHLRRCRNLLQFIVGLVVISVVVSLLGVLAAILIITIVGAIIVGIIAMIIMLWGYIKMISNFKAEVRRTNEAEKAELDAL